MQQDPMYRRDGELENEEIYPGDEPIEIGNNHNFSAV